MSSSSNQAQDILQHLHELRFASLNPESFWKSYIENVSQLCKAKASYIYVTKKDVWTKSDSFGSDNLSKIDEENIDKSFSLTFKRVLQNSFAYDRLHVGNEPSIFLSILLDEHEYEKKILVLIIDNEHNKILSDLIIRAKLVSDVPKSYYEANNKSIENLKSSDSSDELANVLELLNEILKIDSFKLATMTLANELASKYNINQVSIGWKKDAYVKTQAISHVEGLNRYTDAALLLESVYEESYDQNEEIIYPANVEDENSMTITLSHQNYLHKSGFKQIVSLPLRYKNEPVGVITIVSSTFMSENEIYAIRLLSNEVIHWLYHLYLKDMSVFKKSKLFAKNHLLWWSSTDNSSKKVLIIAVSALLLFVLFGSWNYRVEAKSFIDTDNIFHISTPYDGFVSDVKVQTGDYVKKDDLLIVMDAQELYLKESETRADISRYTSQAQKARASNNLADMKISSAKLKQAKAALQRIQYYISKSTIKAPQEGIIVEGSHEELQGAPLSKGDLIYKIANPTQMYLKIKVSEKDIDEIKSGFFGEFTLLSNPDNTFQLRVEQIIPLAQVDQAEGNTFLIKATILSTPQSWWRPGMSGVAKIDIGDKNIFWILTHRATDYLKMLFWW